MVGFASALSQHPDAAQAIGEVIGEVLERVGPNPDVAFLFVASAHIHALEDTVLGDTVLGDTVLEDIVDAVHELVAPGVLVGSVAESIIGGSLEIEEGPAVSLWVGRTGGCEAVRLESVSSSDGGVVVGMPDDAARGSRTLVLLTDPFSFPTEALTDATNSQYPQLDVVGGMASVRGPGRSRLVLDRAIFADGAVGVLLPEGIGEQVVVAQGCRPVGDPYIVTAAQGNLVGELGSRPALERLRNLVDSADDDERELLSHGLHVGLAVDESKAGFDRGDFLIRGVLGADHGSGSLRISSRVEVGTTLQFQVRDAAATDSDLRQMLAGVDADAALLFTCTGRGAHLFGTAHHDASLVSDAVASGPVAGMSCAGELGPVGDVNHVHGFTASILLLYG